MTSFRPNLVTRIGRLPKPQRASDALQPLFEAVSNAIHATQGKFGDQVVEQGRIFVTVSTERKKEKVWATVEDNGPGLDKDNWDAFTTTDTDHKMATGGKGVGRLLWLDCFQNIAVKSTFKGDSGLMVRSFQLRLQRENQIVEEILVPADEAATTGFHVTFEGLRDNGYRDKFPGRGSFIFQHLTSHFLPTFIGQRCPSLTVHVGEETRIFPEAINDIVKRRSAEVPLTTDDYGTLKLTMMECDKVASADLKGLHFIHFIAHNRTVHSQSIDGKLGLKLFGPDGSYCFHGILTGDFLDANVNQERTKFQFEDVVLDRIINDVLAAQVEMFLAEPLAELKSEQKTRIELITASYPSVAFGSTEELQARVPTGELKDDAIYGHLARERFRRDERQAEKIRNVLTRLKADQVNSEDFSAVVAEAGKAIEEAEQRSLTEYIVRRKVVLDFIEILLRKVRDDQRDSSYQREDVLHSFICPLRVTTMPGRGRRVEPASSHDLWIVDERLAFAQYFSSDVDFANLLDEAGSLDRPDLLIFDHVHGLRQTEEPSKVLLVEFKRPGRTAYGDDEHPQFQVERYVRQLQQGVLRDVQGRPIKLDPNTVFYCFIIADIIGKLDDWTYSWRRTVDGRGRIYRPDNGFAGSIELMGWDELLSDARGRNQAFFDRAGISGKSFFSAD